MGKLNTEVQQLGSQLRELRKKEGISQVNLAIKCAIPKQHLYGIEKGIKPVSIQRLQKLFEALGYDLILKFEIKKLK